MNEFSFRASMSAILLMAASALNAATWQIDLNDPANGLADIYSATFDGPLSPCSVSSPTYCSFFQGDVPTTRHIAISPDPSGLVNATPGGITGADPGSYLDLAVNGNSVDLTGGTIAFAPLTLVIANTNGPTTVNPSGIPGFVLNPGLQTAALNANGQAEFLVDLTPATAADFSTLSQIVQPTDCTGPLCPLVGVLSFDMIRYRLFVDYDPAFTSFTADFMGQTSGGSMVYATLDSAVIPVPAAAWLLASGLGLLAAARRQSA